MHLFCKLYIHYSCVTAYLNPKPWRFLKPPVITQWLKSLPSKLTFFIKLLIKSMNSWPIISIFLEAFQTLLIVKPKTYSWWTLYHQKTHRAWQKLLGFESIEFDRNNKNNYLDLDPQHFTYKKRWCFFLTHATFCGKYLNWQKK